MGVYGIVSRSVPKKKKKKFVLHVCTFYRTVADSHGSFLLLGDLGVLIGNFGGSIGVPMNGSCMGILTPYVDPNGIPFRWMVGGKLAFCCGSGYRQRKKRKTGQKTNPMKTKIKICLYVFCIDIKYELSACFRLQLTGTEKKM